MAVIDTSKIEGYDGMTAEQKLEAVLKIELPESPDMSQYVSKSTFDKKASEAADLSKQLREKMTADEAKKADEEKALADLKAEIETLRAESETLRKDKTVSDYTAKYISLGYEKELAAETARAMAEGNMAKVFENGEKHNAAMEKKIKEELMNKTPKPGGAGADDKSEDAAVAKAREIAKSRYGDDKTYNDIMSKYKK